jgi:hypothetical protein
LQTFNKQQQRRINQNIQQKQENFFPVIYIHLQFQPTFFFMTARLVILTALAFLEEVPFTIHPLSMAPTNQKIIKELDYLQ